MQELILTAYLLSAVLFILAIKQMGKVKTARRGNMLSSLGMLIAIAATFYKLELPTFTIILAIAVGTIIGVVSSLRVAMKSMP